MKRKLLQFPISVLLLGILLRSATTFGADTVDYERQVAQRLTNWQAQFGPVDFAPKERWNWMINAHPQPLSAFKALDGEVLSPGIAGDHQAWMSRMFKGTFLSALTNLGPAKYYMNEGRTEPSLLFYELELQGTSIFIQESFQAILLTVKPPRFDAAKGIDRETVGRVLFEWVNVNKRQPLPTPVPDQPGPAKYFSSTEEEGNPFTVPYASTSELLDAFRLPAQLNIGDTFSNWTNPPQDITFHLRYWQAYVVGFVGSNGVSFILFKADYGGPRMGRLHDFNWLNKGLFRADGKTLVDPPKNQRSNDPDRVGEPTTPRK